MSLTVWKANAEPTTPFCVGSGDDSESLTFWIGEDGEVAGGLRHYYEHGVIVNVEGFGVIPAEYVAFEENARLR
jgi:hypothetical protein